MKYTILAALFLSCQLSVFAQTHKITISPNNRGVSLEMTQTDYDNLITNGSNSTGTYSTVLGDHLKSFSKEIYTKFNDEFDFITYIFNANDYSVSSSLGFYGQLSHVSNSVQNIGLGIFDNTAAYGSSGKLKGVIVLTKNNFILNGPTLHEFCHNWANNAITTKDWDSNDNRETSSGGHWGFSGVSDATKGQLGGFDQSALMTNVGGNPNRYSVPDFSGFSNGGNNLAYNKLELYLMGLVPVTDVPAFDVFSGISQVSSSDGTTTFKATTRETYDAARLQSELGERIPTSANSQKSFRTLFVVITPAPLTTDEWTLLDTHSATFGAPEFDDSDAPLYNFYEATGGLATMETGNLSGAVLSVRFDQLNAMIRNGKLHVNWSTIEETNNDHFIVEASKDGVHFSPIETIKSKAANGNSDIVLHYTIEKNMYDLQLNILAMLFISGMMFPFLKTSKRRRYSISVSIILCFISIFFIQCNRQQSDIELNKDNQLYIKIAQVDKDNTKQYSKTIKAIAE